MGGGIFEGACASICSTRSRASSVVSDQTITYFGWERGEIEAVAASRTGPGVSG